MKRKNIYIAGISFLFSLCAFGSFAGVRNNNVEVVETIAQAHFPASTYTGNYYDGLDVDSPTFKADLKARVVKNRCTTNYGAVWDYLIYSDAAYPDGTDDSITAFYKGTPASRDKMNKEHVWPKSHGGNLFEGDPHHTRPTLSADNSDRGNSFYVEGKDSTSAGWDPANCGNEQYRGDAARIIFYCALIRDDVVTLSNLESHQTSNKNRDNMMGKLSDLLKWNVQYPVSETEKLRNDVLNGVRKSHGKSFNFNRNPFIDHPEYVEYIWGDSKPIIDPPVGDTKSLSSLSKSGTLTKSSYVVGESFNPAGLTITANFSDGSTENVTSNVTWDYGEFTSTGTKTVTGSYLYEGTTKTVTVSVTVTQPVAPVVTLTSLTYTGVCETNYAVGEAFDPSGLTITARFSDGSAQNVTNSVSWNYGTFNVAGTISVDGSYTFSGVTKTITITAKVVEDTPPAKTLTSLSYTGGCETNYAVGESFDPNGLTITARFSDGSTEDVTRNVSWNYGTFNVAATISVDGSYTFGGVTKTVTIEVTVEEETPPEKTLVSIACEGRYETNYHVGDEFDPQGLTITATYSDGSTENVTSKVEWEANTSYPGEGTAIGTYNYGGIYRTIYLDILILENDPPPITDDDEGGGGDVTPSETQEDTSDDKLPFDIAGCLGDISTSSVLMFAFTLAAATILLVLKKKEN